MWIKKIELSNVGVYTGVNVFEFNNDKTFNIISGENGNGKTTFLNALIVGLYGSEMYGSTKYTTDYINRINALYSRNALDEYMKIDITFTHNNLTYNFIRKFKFEDSTFIEDEVVYINEIVQNSFSMNKIMNKSFFEFFFFDGENILDVIKSNKITEYVNNFMDVAYEFDVLKLLKKDLLKANTKILNKVSTEEIKLKRKDLKSLTKKIKNTNYEIEIIQKEITICTANLGKIKADIKKLGFLNREDIAMKINRQEEVKGELSKMEKNVVTILKGDINQHLHKSLLEDVFMDLDKSRTSRIKKVIEAYNNLEQDYELEISLDVEKQVYSNYNTDYSTNINKLITEYQVSNRELNKLKKVISTISDGVEYNSYMDNYELFKLRIAKMELEETKLKRILNDLNMEYSNLSQEINSIEKKILKDTLEANAIKVNDKTIKVIDSYIATKRSAVVRKIEDEVVTILNDSLMRKKNYITKIEILDHEINIYSNNQKVDIRNISSGEKQVLIVALSLAIVKAAQVNNALVLDTFIGRLDPTHTKNLLKFIAKDLNNQVIILTTSSEISDVEKAYIKDDISSEYILEYDNLETKVVRSNHEN